MHIKVKLLICHYHKMHISVKETVLKYTISLIKIQHLQVDHILVSFINKWFK